MSIRSKNRLGVRGIAIIEAAKGLLVLVVGLGLMSLAHRDVERFAVGLVRHAHLNPASRYPHIFLEAAANITDVRLWLLAGAASIYAAVRLAEAYGLWFHRRWAEVFGAVTGALYLPVETYELIERVTAVRIVVLLVNSVIVVYLGRLWWSGKRRNV